MKKLLLATAFAAILAACGSKETATTEAPAAADATPPPVTGTAAPSDEQLKQAAAATQESAGSEENAGDASLERMAAMPENVQLPAGKWTAGTHYRPIVPAQSTTAEPGQVEVLEILWLGCPHCSELEPFVDNWDKKKPAYIKFVQEHVMWGPAHRGHAKLFYTLEALGRGDLVPKAFEEIHQRGNVLLSRNGNDAETEATQTAFAKANGIKEVDFKREYNGFGVNTRLQRAEEIMRRYRVETVPVVIVNGKYQTDVGMAGGPEKLVQLINDLSAAEKGR